METNKQEKEQEKEQEVLVKILLNGGHQYSLVLKSNASLLKNLLSTIFNKVRNPENRTIFQIPLEAGQAALCFSSNDLVGILTEPPIYIRPQEQSENGQQTNQQNLSIEQNEEIM
jgi:hypothetical protein